MEGAQVAAAAGATWQTLNERSRQDAAVVMVEGGTKMLLEKFAAGEINGAIGLAGANGTNLVCSLPVVTLPRAQGGGQRGRRHCGRAMVCGRERHCHVSIDRRHGAQPRHRIGPGERCAGGGRRSKKSGSQTGNPIGMSPLVAVSSFGGTAGCVDRVSERLEALGYEVILFSASGVGGKSLERLAASASGRRRRHHDARAYRPDRRRRVFGGETCD